MLAARVPTAISRQDLSRLDAASPRRSPRHQRRAVWEDLWDREVVAYAVVSFCYALGQSLYDIFQSQQAKLMTSSLLQRWSVSDEDGYVAAYAYALLVSAYAFAKAVSSPYVGFLSDRFGRRPYSCHFGIYRSSVTTMWPSDNIQRCTSMSALHGLRRERPYSQQSDRHGDLAHAANTIVRFIHDVLGRG